MLSDKATELHKQISSMSLGDLCLLTGQAINMKMDKTRVDVLLKYLEISIVRHRLKTSAPSGDERGES